MKKRALTKNWMLGISLMILGGSMNACAMGGTSWKEEVLLHDGSKIIVERSQTYGGRHEIGQKPPIKEEDITFSLSGSSQAIIWTSEYSEDIGRANFEPLALHIADNIPFIVTAPNLCLAYNKWGRPNPPYVIFRFDGGIWHRIALPELPAEFNTINLVINTTKREAEVARRSLVSAEVVKQLNGSLTQPEYKTILRMPLPESALCPDYNSPRYMSPKAPYPITPQGTGGGQ